MVGSWRPLQDLRLPQPCCQTLEQLLQAVPGALCLGQQAGAVPSAWQGLDAAQLQVQHWRWQRDACQVFGQQALQVGGVATGLGAAQQQFALAGGVSACIHGPAQHQRQHRLLAQLQPVLQLLEQSARTKQQRRSGFDLRGQFQPGLKHLGQQQPGVAVWALAAGLVERLQQWRTKTPRHASTRQGPQLTPAGATQGRQRGKVRTGRRQCRQGQLRRGGLQKPWQQTRFGC